MRIRVAVGEGVESSTEEHVLRNALCNGAGEIVFGVSAARNQESAKGDGKGTVRTRRSAAQLVGVGDAKDRNGDGIFENKRLRIVKLMCGAAQGYAKGRSGWEGFLHDELRYLKHFHC
jgi:hypothetical protein